MTSGSLQTRREQERIRRERSILRAAIEELALSDYGGLTIEKVALRAGVNKTTVYRKWETKGELIRSALLSVSDTYRVEPTSGNLRGDLLRIARVLQEFTLSFEGRCLMRLRLVSELDEELAEIANELNERKRKDINRILDAAVSRGEVAPDIDIMMVVDMLWGAVYVRAVSTFESIDDRALQRMVDFLIKGTAASSRTATAKPNKLTKAAKAVTAVAAKRRS